MRLGDSQVARYRHLEAALARRLKTLVTSARIFSRITVRFGASRSGSETSHTEKLLERRLWVVSGRSAGLRKLNVVVAPLQVG